MNSRSLVIGSIAVGIAIGYIASFLTYYNTLSNAGSVNAVAVKGQLDELKNELAKSNTKLSVLSDDNEKLRSNLSQVRADNEALQKRVNSLQGSMSDSNGSLARIEHGIKLLQMASSPMPFAGQELTQWRLTVVNETARLDPKLVPTMLKLVDSWVDIVQLEEKEPELNTTQWNEWNKEWQQKALVYIDDYNTAISQITTKIIGDIDSLKASLS